MNFLVATYRVTCDKLYDYIKYYCALEFLDVNNNNIDDNIKDYDNIINISEINEEGKKKRILKNAGIIKEYTNFFTEPSYIIDNIYLGSAFNAASYETLIKYNIKIIINVTKEVSCYFLKHFNYYQCEIYDNNKESIFEHFDNINDFIVTKQCELLINNNWTGNILIHCYMGASRSASVVLYYLIKNKNYGFNDALNFLKLKRPLVNPTFRFTKDLAKTIVVKDKLI